VPSLLTKRTTGTVVFDLEANGLLHNANEIFCVALYWHDEDIMESFNDQCPGKGMSSPVVRSLQWLETADIIVGHNIIGYDIPLIKSIYHWFNPTGILIDTLILSRLYHPNLYDIDKNTGKIPTKMYGSHSLEAYGHRLNEYKGDFSKTTDWQSWSQEMEDYCIQDVVVTKKLCDHFHPYLSGSI